MTPLAHALVADSTLPVKHRRYGDAAKELRLLDGVHFFDVSAVMDAARGLAVDLLRHPRPLERLAFLPAPRVLLEWAEPGGRAAVLLEAAHDDTAAKVTSVAMFQNGGLVAPPGNGWLCLHGLAGLRGIAFSDGLQPDHPEFLDAILYALLAMINTPRVIGRRQHMPHAGLQRKIAAAHRMPGKYPLQAWHELVLEVSPPRDESGLPPREGRLTGGKALHFVRCHLRIRLGQLELITAHWKGDPALGIKQTRYRMVPPRSAA